MNLLPLDIIKRKQTQSLIIRLAAVQAVIFLLFILFVWSLHLTIGFREQRIAQLDAKLQDERFINSEAIAQALQDRNAQNLAQQEAVQWFELPTFYIERFEMIKETLPPGVRLIHADLDEEGATLSFITNNLSLADIHREAWSDTGLVSRVQLISAVSSAEMQGDIRYVLGLRWLE